MERRLIRIWLYHEIGYSNHKQNCGVEYDNIIISEHRFFILQMLLILWYDVFSKAKQV